MRSPSAFEVILLARVLMRVEPAERPATAMSILAETDVADHGRKLTGRAHHAFGDGSLMARCRLFCPPPEPLADDGDFLTCMVLASQAVLLHYCR
jgi:hypothetical protein